MTDTAKLIAEAQAEHRFCPGCGYSDWPTNCPTACPVKKFLDALEAAEAERDELSRCVLSGWTSPAFARGRLHERAIEIARAALDGSDDG